MKKALVSGKINGTKQIEPKKELKLLDGKNDKIDYRRSK